jgi:hypothetical protein
MMGEQGAVILRPLYQVAFFVVVRDKSNFLVVLHSNFFVHLFLVLSLLTFCGARRAPIQRNRMTLL